MANNIAGVFRNTARAKQIVDRILKKVAGQEYDADIMYGSSRKIKNVYSSAGAPTLDATTGVLLWPVKRGDLVIDITADALYICEVEPTASTAATFTILHT